MDTKQTLLQKLGLANTETAPLESGAKVSPKDAAALVAWARANYESSKSDRSAIQTQWGMNMSMYRGKQYTEFIAKTRQFTTLPAAPWRVRHTTNLIRPLIRTETARLTSQKPSASVVPASSEDADLMAAQAGEQVWESIYGRKKLHTVFRRMAFWQLVCGTAFIKTYWDDNMQDKDSDAQGDIAFGHVTPFHLYVPDLREEEIENQEFVTNVYTRPVESLMKTFGDRFTHALQPTTFSSNDIISDAYMDIQGQGDRKPDSCLVIETWVKPGAHRQFPNGGLLTTVDDQLIQFSPDGLPYQHGEYPFTKFDHIPSGKFYADSSIVDTIPLQREYNRTMSQIVEAKNRMAKPKMAIQKGSLDPKKVNTEAGQFVEYKMGFQPPQPIPMPELPAYVFNHAQMMRADMEDITGQHQVSKGSAPAGVTAATAINYLQERDDAYLTHTYQSVEEGWQKIAHQVLSLAVQYWEEERLIRVVGSDGSFDAIMLKNSDLKSGTDIRMEAGSSLPTSKSAKQAFLLDMMGRGFIPPEKGLELMEMGGVQKLYDSLKIDERAAQRENLRLRGLADEDIEAHNMQFATPDMAAMPNPMDVAPDPMGMGGAPVGADPMADPMAQPTGPVDMATGQEMEPTPVVPVNSWDNHAVHIEIHNRFRKGQAFESLSEEVKAQFELHVELHKSALMTSMMPPPGAEGMPGDPAGGPMMPDGGSGESNNQFNTLPGG